jgi:hypothetical protein
MPRRRAPVHRDMRMMVAMASCQRAVGDPTATGATLSGPKRPVPITVAAKEESHEDRRAL